MGRKAASPPARQLPLGARYRTRVDKASPSAAALRGCPKDFLSVLDFDADLVAESLSLAARLKKERRLGRRAPTAQALAARHVALLFEKPSLRTRTTFEIAVRELGGDVIAPAQDVALSGREAPRDVARNLERWVSAVVIRTFAQESLVSFAEAAPSLHVINALTDTEHPCQAMADIMTMREAWGELRGRTVAFVGDGNNVATSLVQAGMLTGVHVRVASPAGYELPAHVVAEASRARVLGATLTLEQDPVVAVRDADAVYTDVWTSMGQETEALTRKQVFQPYRVDARLMSHAASDAIFMHCLPAHRGEEVTDEVMDGPAAVVFDQSENRLHAQKALLLMLLGGT